jgi:mycoredoxin
MRWFGSSAEPPWREEDTVSMESDIEAADEGAGVIMYCRSWCGDCARARRWLDAHNIPYTEVDVEADLAARERAAGHNEGRLHTPTFEIGDGVCVDFRPEKLTELLGIE